MNWGDDLGGGGFMNDSVVDEPQQLTSSVSVGGEEKNKTITAVSIAQIHKFTRPNEGLVLFGKKTYTLSLVALIYEVLDINPQKIHVLLDDYSSEPLEMTHILSDIGTPGEDPDYSMFQEGAIQQENNGEVPKKLCDLRVGDYVHCVGVVKYSQDKPSFIAYHLAYVHDPQVPNMHALEVIRDAMYAEKLQQNGGVLPSVAVTGNANSTSAAPSSKFRQNNDNMSNNPGWKLMTTRDQYVIKVLREGGQEKGMSLHEISSKLPAMPVREIEESLATLSAEGLCWQGDSEDVWCANAAD